MIDDGVPLEDMEVSVATAMWVGHATEGAWWMVVTAPSYETRGVGHVAEDRHAVADRKDLLEEVRDEQDGHPRVTESPDHREEHRDLAIIETRCRFIEH